ncbi:1,4-beta-xylanase [Hymenobacter coccineus]|uniref:1,4-beta-xylanase n=2 Tax=Hymenobacter coccineus TaxID=1908235 RepID=A0A1G1TFR5_9BACT|nr:1,4-beta-xylanase [Hymenobacter coccineus]
MKIKSWLSAVFLMSLPLAPVLAQPVLPLYTGNIPNSIPSNGQEKSNTEANGNVHVTSVVQPSLTVYVPPAGTANGTSIIVCPGGGYGFLSMTNEGTEIAQRFTGMGITVFILKYRLPNDAMQPDKSIAPLMDAQQALRLVREVAPKYNLNPERIGLMGFSAGGHLAATAGTQFAKPVGPKPGPASVRPAFLMLIYPVISFSDSLAHGGSRTNLLGQNPTAAQMVQYSADRQVTAQTPPTFLVHAQDDKTVKVQNSLAFYEACVHHGVPAEMHLFAKGGHGFGLHNGSTTDDWSERLREWLAANGWLTR